MTKYELTYLIRPNIDDAAKTALVERFDKILTDNGATIESSKDWEKRKLAYEIQKFREATYHIVNLEAASDSEALSEFDRLAKISEDILRHMVVIVEEYPGIPSTPARPARGARNAEPEVAQVADEVATEPAAEAAPTVEAE